MPLPDEVDTWLCDGQDTEQCRPSWQHCTECDGRGDYDAPDCCPTCQGSGGGYICRTHDMKNPP